MAIIGFNNQILSAFGQTPSNLGWLKTWTLSGAGQYKTVELQATGSGNPGNPALSAKKIRGIAFNTLLSSAVSPASGTGTFASLSVLTGTSFRVDTAYTGQLMGLIYDDGTTSLFTVTTGATTTRQPLTANGYDTVYPEIRRLYVLGYR